MNDECMMGCVVTTLLAMVCNLPGYKPAWLEHMEWFRKAKHELTLHDAIVAAHDLTQVYWRQKSGK